MKALVLSALAVDEEHGPAALEAVETALRERGHDVDTVDVDHHRELDLGIYTVYGAPYHIVVTKFPFAVLLRRKELF